MKVNFKNNAMYEAGRGQWSLYKYDLDNDYYLSSFRLEIRSGRYPEIGYLSNERSHELIFVADGTGTLHIKGRELRLSEGDSVFIYENEAYYWDMTSNLTLYVVHNPPWLASQQKLSFEP